LGIVSKRNRIPSFSQSLKYSLFYFVIALLFGCWIGYNLGMVPFKEYITAFLVEKALALDNIFVISLIFTFLAIPSQYQHRVLFWGIMGVIIFRAIFISLGATLLSNFAWILYIFAAILVITGIKILFFANKKPSIENNAVLKLLNKNFNVTKELHAEKFLVKLNGRWHLTSLFVALILIEALDLVFAIDSIPAVFAITLDPYLVYTSNIFAILGLRALYFCLSNIIEKFTYMKYSLGIVLIFIGLKVFLHYFGMKMSPLVSLIITVSILAGGIIASLIKIKKSTI